MASCSPAKPAPARFDGRCLWLWGCAPMAKRKSSTSVWPPAKARPNGKNSWQIFIVAGLTGEGLEMICVDGGKGLLAALPDVFHGIAIQRCWAHKIRNVLKKVRKADQARAKRALHKVMNAPHAAAARSHARKFADEFEQSYPAAVDCLRGTTWTSY